jgi:hypothetical protein
LKEELVFADLERDMVSKLHELVYYEHLSTMSALVDDDFRQERDSARSRHVQRGQLLTPWLRWTPERTVADLVRDSQLRRSDPVYMQQLRQLQDELDSDAQRIKDAVEKELQLRQKAVVYRQEQRAAQVKPLGRRYVRVPTRSRALR